MLVICDLREEICKQLINLLVSLTKHSEFCIHVLPKKVNAGLWFFFKSLKLCKKMYFNLDTISVCKCNMLSLRPYI